MPDKKLCVRINICILKVQQSSKQKVVFPQNEIIFKIFAIFKGNFTPGDHDD